VLGNATQTALEEAALKRGELLDRPRGSLV